MSEETKGAAKLGLGSDRSSIAFHHFDRCVAATVANSAHDASRIRSRHSPADAREAWGEVPFGAKPKNSPALGNKEQDGTIYRST
jgi:hypothetical protein